MSCEGAETGPALVLEMGSLESQEERNVHLHGPVSTASQTQRHICFVFSHIKVKNVKNLFIQTKEYCALSARTCQVDGFSRQK